MFMVHTYFVIHEILIKYWRELKYIKTSFLLDFIWDLIDTVLYTYMRPSSIYIGTYIPFS